MAELLLLSIVVIYILKLMFISLTGGAAYVVKKVN